MARLLEARAVMILRNHIDDGGNFVAFESRAAELADSPSEGVRILWRKRGYFGCNDLACDQIRVAAHGDIFHVIEFEQNVLDLSRMHFLAAHVYQLRLAAEDAKVLSISFDKILRIEPTVCIER